MNRFSTVPSAEYCQLKKESTIPNSVVCIFMTGFCLGMVFFYMSDKVFAKETGMLADTSISRLRDFDVNKEGLLQYVMMQRLKQFLLIALCAFSSMKLILLQGIIGVIGFELGLLLFTAVYRYGVAGVFFCMMLFIPHGICYLMLIIKLVHMFSESNTKYYHKVSRIKIIQDILLILLLLGIGILCETYLNPYMVRMASFWL